MKLDIDNGSKVTEPDFAEKFRFSRKIAENWSKLRFFGIFSETTIEILVINRQNVEDDSVEQTQKTAGLNLFKKSRYLR